MKSYWIAGTIILLGTWPSGTNAYATGGGQSPAVEKPAQQVQSSTPAPAAPQETGNDALKTTQPAASAAPAAPAVSAPSTSAQTKGSYLLVELSKGLKVKKLKPGDKVKAEVTQDVVSHGKVIIPVETELIGHVTEVSVRDEGNPESRLGIVFDRIVLKHYHDINCQAVVQALAPPVIKRSRVDQPSQMLPPSMMGSGARQSGAGPVGRSSGSSANRSGSSTAMSSSNSIGNQAPLTVKQSPTTSVTSGTSAAQLDVAPGGKPLSIGMPQGVTGLKGLSLSAGPTTSTPGPLIVSSTDNVKLEPGTQILLHVLRVEMPSIEEKK